MTYMNSAVFYKAGYRSCTFSADCCLHGSCCSVPKDRLQNEPQPFSQKRHSDNRSFSGQNIQICPAALSSVNMQILYHVYMKRTNITCRRNSEKFILNSDSEISAAGGSAPGRRLQQFAANSCTSLLPRSEFPCQKIETSNKDFKPIDCKLTK